MVSAGVAVVLMTCPTLWAGPVRPPASHSYSDCQLEFGHMDWTHASDTSQENTGAILRIVPHYKSDQGNTINTLNGVSGGKWLGVVVNEGTATSAMYRVPANRLTPVCVWLESDEGTPLISLIWPNNSTETRGFMPCSTGPSNGPHAAWTGTKTCATPQIQFLPNKKGPQPLGNLAASSLFTSRAAWISCASDGCCRVQP